MKNIGGYAFALSEVVCNAYLPNVGVACLEHFAYLVSYDFPYVDAFLVARSSDGGIVIGINLEMRGKGYAYADIRSVQSEVMSSTLSNVTRSSPTVNENCGPV